MKNFIKPDATVYAAYPPCEDSPVLEATVAAVFDDGSVELDDPYLGSVTVEADMVFETRGEAEAALRA